MSAISFAALGMAFKRLYQGSPAAPAPPTFQYPGTATTGGTIGSAVTRYYVVTAVVNGVETLPSAELSFQVGSGTSTNTVTLYSSAVQGATAYNWYGASASGSEVKLGSSSTPSFTDTGAAGSGAPPSSTALSEVTATPGLYTPPNGKTALVRSVTVSNPTPVSGTVTLSVVPSGGTGGAGNRIISGLPVPPDANGAGPFEYGCFQALNPGDFITGSVSVAGMVLTVNGLELTT